MIVAIIILWLISLYRADRTVKVGICRFKLEILYTY